MDFTEVAVAGKELGDWEVLAYGPIMLVELGFDESTLSLAPRHDPYSLGHLVERAGGLRTTGLQAWYRKPEQDPWASFKVMVQHRGGPGSQWSLGPVSLSWPLTDVPRMFRAPSPCWRRDVTKPPLASLITTAAHRTLSSSAWGIYAKEAQGAPSALEAMRRAAASVGPAPVEGEETWKAIEDQFMGILLGSGEPLGSLFDSQGRAQRQSYSDIHLALLLVDYWRLASINDPPGEPIDVERRLAETREIAASRRFPELYGDHVFERIMRDLADAVFVQNVSFILPGHEAYPPYVCLAAQALYGSCEGNSCISVI